MSSPLAQVWYHRGRRFRLQKGGQLLLPGGTPKAPSQAPSAAEVAQALYVPGGGLKLSGHFYQGGEKVPPGVLAKLSPGEEKRLVTRTHADPEKAALDLLENPASTNPEERIKVPSVGRRNPTGYDDPHYPSPAKKAGKRTGAHHVPTPFQPWVSEDEARSMTHLQAKRLVRIINDAPPVFEYAEAARMGAAGRRWYQAAKQAFATLFGEEAPRFTALFAATSPREGPREDLLKALEIWDRYLKAREANGGRQLSAEQAVAVVRQAAQEVKLVHANESSYTKAAVTALSTEDPTNAEYPFFGTGAPKINAFRLNLMGDLYRTTNDMWVAALGGFDPDRLKDIGVYLANSVKLRKAAELLNSQLRPGEERWTPAEVQAAAWSVVRSLAYIGGHSRTKKVGGELIPKDPLQALAALTHETVQQSTNVIRLIANDERTRATLQRLGLTKAAARVLRAYQKTFGDEAQAYRGPVVTGGEDPAERAAHESIARKAGQYVGAFVKGHVKKFKKEGEAVTPPAPTAPPAAGTTVQPAVTAPAPPPAPAAQPQAMIGASQNVQEGLSFDQALQKYHSANQAAFRKLIDHIRKSLGLEGTSHDAVGDWQNEAESSVLQQIQPQSAEPERIKYAAAWYGLLGNQKAVLYFLPGRNGTDSTYTAEIPETDVAAVRKQLDAVGVRDRTIIPTNKGMKVVFYDEGRRLRDQFLTFAGAYPNARVSETTGTGKFIGAATRSAARRQYRGIIAAYERSHPRPAAVPGGGPQAPGGAAGAPGGQAAGGAPAAPGGGGANPAAGEALRLHRRRVSPAGRQKVRRLARIGREETLKAVDEAIFRGLWHRGYQLLAAGDIEEAIRRWLAQGREQREPVPPAYHGALSQGQLRSLTRDITLVYPGISSGLVVARMKHMVQNPRAYDYLFTEREARKQLGLMKLENSQDWFDTRDLVQMVMKRDKGQTVGALAHQVLKGDVGLLPILADAVEEEGNEVLANRFRRMTPYHLRKAEDPIHFPVRPPFQTRPEPPPAEAPAPPPATPTVTKKQPGGRPKPGEPGYSPPDFSQASFEQFVLSDEYKHRYLGVPRKKYAAVKAPAQGIVVRGVYYQGGKFIPTAELEKANFDQHQQVEKAREKLYRRPDGSYDLTADLASRRRGRKKYARGERPESGLPAADPEPLPAGKEGLPHAQPVAPRPAPPPPPGQPPVQGTPSALTTPRAEGPPQRAPAAAPAPAPTVPAEPRAAQEAAVDKPIFWGRRHAPLTAKGPPALPRGLVVTGHERGDVRRILLNRFGDEDLDLDLLAAAANAVNGSQVHLHAADDDLNVIVSNRRLGVEAERTFSRSSTGLLTVHNDSQIITAPSRGRGFEVFVNQVKALLALGVDRIETLAAGHYEPRETRNAYSFIGYAVWPKFGFTGKMRVAHFQNLPRDVQQALGTSRRVEDVFDLPDGDAIWERYGGSFSATFDLRPGSVNRKRLEKYMARRLAKKGG